MSSELYLYITCWYALQGGYPVDYATQGAHGAFPGNFMNQNSQAGYSHFSGSNDFMSQVCFSRPFLPTQFFILKIIFIPTSEPLIAYAGVYGTWSTWSFHPSWLYRG